MARRRPPPRTASPHEQVRRHLVQRLYVRFHMFLILGTAGLSGMLVSGLLLKLGVHQMLIRYPIAVLCAYGMFLLCVGLWLRYVARVRREPPEVSGLDGANVPDGSDLLGNLVDGSAQLGRGGGQVSGSGGQFGGGGASGAWPEPAPQQGFIGQPASGPASPGRGFDFNFDFDLDGDGLILLVLAIAVIAAIAFASGYILWFAPDILAEAVVGASLAGGLARSAQREDAGGWVAGVVRRTWWPFAIVLLLCAGFAGMAQSAYPGVLTAKEALIRAVAHADVAQPIPEKAPETRP